VTDNKEMSYLREMMLQERALASAGECASARAAHADLAAFYEARLMMGHLDQANAERPPNLTKGHTQLA
jgi:hypothetical protein